MFFANLESASFLLVDNILERSLVTSSSRDWIQSTFSGLPSVGSCGIEDKYMYHASLHLSLLSPPPSPSLSVSVCACLPQNLIEVECQRAETAVQYTAVI